MQNIKNVKSSDIIRSSNYPLKIGASIERLIEQLGDTPRLRASCANGRDRTQEDNTTGYYDAEPNPRWHVQFTRDSPSSLADIGPRTLRAGERLSKLAHRVRISGSVSLHADKRSAWRRHGSAIPARRTVSVRAGTPDAISSPFGFFNSTTVPLC